jgi:hypothetical protein
MPDNAALVDALTAGRYLATTSAAILALPRDSSARRELLKELKQNLDARCKAIRAVVKELARTRQDSVRFGDIAAPTAHEAAIEMACALHREHIGMEVLGKAVRTWPKRDELCAVIELEHRAAVSDPSADNASSPKLLQSVATAKSNKPPAKRRKKKKSPEPTIWYHGDRSYSADRKSPISVTREQHNILKCFLDHNRSLTTEELGKTTSNVSAVVTKLAERFGSAVQQPLRKGDGYFIRVRTLKVN